MVKSQKQNIAKTVSNQGEDENPSEASKIGPSTRYGLTSQRLSPFGGLLGLVKFFDLVKFEEIFDIFYRPPSREPLLGHYKMMSGILMLLFIGFNRVWHFKYIQKDSMLCSILKVKILPYVTTFWRYVDSLGINQGRSLLKLMSALRERVWHLCGLSYERIHIDIDPTVETIYGNQQGGRKGHNTKHRGKKGYRPVLCFIEETREYLCGKLRIGETISGEEVSKLIHQFKDYLPGCIQEVIVRADAEMMCWQSVKAAIDNAFHFIFANKQCTPPFDESKWYKIRKDDTIEYNDCMYQPTDWGKPCRFVVMRIPIEEPSTDGPVQLALLKVAKYKYRIFVTDFTYKAHKVIKCYDKRADCENLVGESNREGLSAITSRKFANNYAFFQIVMLTYNIWRSFKLLAGHSGMETETEIQERPTQQGLAQKDIVNNTIRIARLKLLTVAAKITGHSGVNEVKYSEHDSRTSSLFRFYEYLDKRRRELRPWFDEKRWESKHLPLILAQEGAL